MGGGDQDCRAPFGGHRPVPCVEVVVGAAGRGEYLPEQQPQPLGIDTVVRVVRVG
jgi:hypothetical protein